MGAGGKHRLPYLAAGFSLTFGCGRATLTPIESPAGCPLPALEAAPPPPARLLDDLEDGDRFMIKSPDSDASEGTVDGTWDLWDDKTNPALRMEISARCAAFGRYAIRVSSPGQMGWGASLNGFFRGSPQPKPFDASAWNAVSFYAALATDDQPPMEIKAGISTMDTAWNGRCTNCVDNYGRFIVLTNRWQRFVLRFADLKQTGWGQPAGLPMRTDEVVQLHLPFDGSFDVWIDQLALERLP